MMYFRSEDLPNAALEAQGSNLGIFLIHSSVLQPLYCCMTQALLFASMNLAVHASYPHDQLSWRGQKRDYLEVLHGREDNGMCLRKLQMSRQSPSNSPYCLSCSQTRQKNACAVGIHVLQGKCVRNIAGHCVKPHQLDLFACLTTNRCGRNGSEQMQACRAEHPTRNSLETQLRESSHFLQHFLGLKIILLIMHNQLAALFCRDCGKRLH